MKTSILLLFNIDYILKPHMFLTNFLINFYIISMLKQEKLNRIEILKKQASELKKEVDYYNALQLALKLVLNGSYV